MQIVLLGPPGSGKGTLAVDLMQRYNLPQISTGDIFRQNIKDKTPLGLAAAQYINSGGLVPDEVTIAMVADRLAQPSCAAGFILDGFPRTVTQAEALNELLSKMNLPLTAVVNLDASQETILSRLSSRRLCSKCGRGYNTISLQPKIEGICDDDGSPLIQRDDDKPETVRKRLVTYFSQTEPLINFYKASGFMININSEAGMENTMRSAETALDILQQRSQG